MATMRLVREDEMASEDKRDEEDKANSEPAVPEEEMSDGPVQETEEDGQSDEVGAQSSGQSNEHDGADVDLGVLEALLFSTHHPLTTGRLAELMDFPATRPLRNAIRELNKKYQENGRSFRVEQVAGGYQLLTLPEYGEYLKNLHKREADTRLSRAALETLAIIAYKQPILRAEIESIRGVACGETIRSLMEKHLVKIAGRAEEPGRPILYGTTRRFLEIFGLNSLKELPQSEDLNRPQE